MGTQSKRSSPNADSIGLTSLGQSAAYGDGQGGNEYGFDTGQAMSLPGVTHANHDVNGSSDWAAWSAPATMPDNIQDFAGAFDTSMLPSPDLDNDSTSHPAERSGMHRHLFHRSVGSDGLFSGHDQQSSATASDSTTPNNHRAPDRYVVDHPGDGDVGGEAGDAMNAQAHDEHGKADDVMANAVPSWSELKTKAGKERKRLPLACIACRRKKIRCSGEKPACKHCLRSRIPCVYKVTTRKAAPRTDYMAMLDKRLKRMEERVIKIIPKEEQGVVTVTGRAVVKPPLPTAPPKPGGATKKRVAGEAFGDELDEWASVKPTNPVPKELTTQTAESEALKTSDPDEHSLLLEGADKLPPRDLQEHLSEVFFDHIYGQSYHLLHKPSFMRKLAQGTVPAVLMLSICAISARFSNHPAVRTEPAFLRGEEWANPAREIALKRYDTPTITILIVYMILGLHEFGTCQGGRSWMLSGMAQRMAYALQLHRDLDHDPRDQDSNQKAELTPLDREIRRRTMWACFLMDRFCSSGTERPIFVGEQYIFAQLPIKESYFLMEVTGPTENLDGEVPNPVEPGTGQIANAKENMGVAAYVIRLVALWGNLIHYMNLGGKARDSCPMWDDASKFCNIRRQVAEWKESLPDSLHYNQENLQNHASEKIANQFLFMHITYHQILLFMHRFALPMPGARPIFPAEMPENFITDAARTARTSANNISALVHEAMDHVVVVPFVGYAAFFSSTVHIQGAFSKNPQLEATSKQNLARNVKYLTKIKKHWGMFHFVTENLRDLYRKHADTARSGGKNGKGHEPSIFQYGDWFDRYPHGVSGTDYEGPSTDVQKEPGSDAVLGQNSDLQTVEEFFAKLSPPSRAVQAQQQAAKRAAKRRRASKPDGNRPSQTTAVAQQPQQQPQQQQQDESAPSTAQSLESPSEQITHDLASTQGFQHSAGLDQYADPFPPGFRQPSSALLMDFSRRQQQQQQQQQQVYVNQVDHPMPLNPFSHEGNNNGANQQLQPPMNGNMLDHNNSMDFGTFDFGTLVGANDQGNNNFWGDQSNSWFMPFNVNPPQIGEDNNVFAANYAWSNTFAGFGDDGAGLLPTSLPMQPPADAEINEDDLGNEPSMSNLHGLDHMS